MKLISLAFFLYFYFFETKIIYHINKRKQLSSIKVHNYCFLYKQIYKVVQVLLLTIYTLFKITHWLLS